MNFIPAETIFIESLVVDTLIGIADWEQRVPQRLVLDVELVLSRPFSELDDDIQKTVDYALIAEHIAQNLQAQPFKLLETAAHVLTDMLLQTYPLSQVTLTLRKPQALLAAQAAGVRITKSQTPS